jgi:hypothetical protein
MFHPKETNIMEKAGDHENAEKKEQTLCTEAFLTFSIITIKNQYVTM